MNYFFPTTFLLAISIFDCALRVDGRTLEALGVRLPATVIALALIIAVALCSLGDGGARHNVSLYGTSAASGRLSSPSNKRRLFR
jgi:hypothetical protein